MSQSPNESPSEHETPEVGLVPDEDLPEDLQPKENPLAADPEDSEAGDGAGAGGDGASGVGASGEQKVDGLPDMGEAGAGG